MPDPAEGRSLSDQEARDAQSNVPDVSWRALARATYDQAVEIMEKPPLIGTMRELFDHRLGTYGQAYEVMNLVEAYSEIERLREALTQADVRFEQIRRDRRERDKVFAATTTARAEIARAFDEGQAS